MFKGNNFERMCSFYVSNIHLSTMILPYLSEKLGKGEVLTTFLEKDLQKEMELLLSKTNIKEELKNIINNINWYKTEKTKYTEIESNINRYKNTSNINILVAGTKEYIENINKNIETYIINNNNIYVNIIDAYEVEENKKNFNEILRNYKYIINTSGKHLIKDVFEGVDTMENRKII